MFYPITCTEQLTWIPLNYASLMASYYYHLVFLKGESMAQPQPIRRKSAAISNFWLRSATIWTLLRLQRKDFYLVASWQPWLAVALLWAVWMSKVMVMTSTQSFEPSSVLSGWREGGSLVPRPVFRFHCVWPWLIIILWLAWACLEIQNWVSGWGKEKKKDVG